MTTTDYTSSLTNALCVLDESNFLVFNNKYCHVAGGMKNWFPSSIVHVACLRYSKSSLGTRWYTLCEVYIMIENKWSGHVKLDTVN